MAVELYANGCSTTVTGGYTPGSGVLNVASTASPFPATGNYRVIIMDSTKTTVKVVLKVTGVNSSTQFAVTAEGTDASALDGDPVLGTEITKGMLDALRGDMAGVGAFSSLPSTTNQKAGNRYYVTDTDACPFDYVFDGTIWQARYKGPKLESPFPAIGSFTQVDSGSTATFTDYNGALWIKCPATENNLKILYMAAPVTTPWTLTVRIISQMSQVNFNHCGLVVGDSGGRWEPFGPLWATTYQIFVGAWTSNTATTTDRYLPGSWYGDNWGTSNLYLRVTDDGTNLKYSVSSSGYEGTFVQLYTELRGAFLTSNPSRIGIHANAHGASPAMGVLGVYWKVA